MESGDITFMLTHPIILLPWLHILGFRDYSKLWEKQNSRNNKAELGCRSSTFKTFQTISQLLTRTTGLRIPWPLQAEVEFVHPVSAGGSVKFVASGVNFSIFTNFLCFFLLKLLKLGEIDGVEFLTWKSGGVKFWTNFMSVITLPWCQAEPGVIISEILFAQSPKKVAWEEIADRGGEKRLRTIWAGVLNNVT